MRESFFFMTVTFNMPPSGAKTSVQNDNWRFSLIFSGAGGLIYLFKCYCVCLNPHIMVRMCRFVSLSIAGMCCHKVLFEYFDEDPKTISSEEVCCGVCDSVKSEDMKDVQDEYACTARCYRSSWL